MGHQICTRHRETMKFLNTPENALAPSSIIWSLFKGAEDLFFKTINQSSLIIELFLGSTRNPLTIEPILVALPATIKRKLWLFVTGQNCSHIYDGCNRRVRKKQTKNGYKYSPCVL